MTTEIPISESPALIERVADPDFANSAGIARDSDRRHDHSGTAPAVAPVDPDTEKENAAARSQRSDEARRENARLREVRERDLLARDHVFSVADAMPEAMAAFGRMEERARAFRASIRPRFEAAPLLAPCQTHPGEMLAKAWDETCLASRQHDAFTLARTPCVRCAEAAAMAAQRGVWRRRGVPERLLDATFANYIAKSPGSAAAMAEVRDSTAPFVILVGAPGTGKSHLAVAALRARGRGLFITHADMMGELRASYQTHTTQEVIAAWRETPALVIDDFGVACSGRDEEPLLYQVLATRHDCRRLTILTSNLALEDLRAILGGRLMDRMAEECTTMTFDWPSFRGGRRLIG